MLRICYVYIIYDLPLNVDIIVDRCHVCYSYIIHVVTDGPAGHMFINKLNYPPFVCSSFPRATVIDFIRVNMV